MSDAEADLRRKLADSARTFVILIRRTHATPDTAVDGLVRDASGSPDRLRDAIALLGEDEQEPRALLARAVRYAQDPRAPEPPRDASRYGGSGGSAPARGGSRSGGGCYSGEDPRPTS